MQITSIPIKIFLKRIISLIKEFLLRLSQFWLKIAIYDLINSITLALIYVNLDFLPKKISKKILKKNILIKIKFLEKNFHWFIENYKTKEIERKNWKKIWFMWWQGEDNLTDVGKLCLYNLKKHNWWYEIIIIHKDNFDKYISLPTYILKKVKEWKISFTHLSDVIRMWLLSKYWWIRVDSTLLIRNDNVIKQCSNNNFYCYKDNSADSLHLFEPQITDFFLWWTSNEIFSFCYDFLLEYYKKYDIFVDYLSVMYCLYIAFSHFTHYQCYIGNIPECWRIKNNWAFINKLNEIDSDKKIYEDLWLYSFAKLSNKIRIIKEKNWKLTNFWKLLQSIKEHDN